MTLPDGGTRAMYVYTSGYGNSIVTFAFDPVTATLTPKNTPARVDSPSFLAWTTPTHEIFALAELASGRVFGFSVNPATGALTPVNDVSSGGAGPAHILADPTNKWVLVADYDSDTAAVLGVQPNGMLVAPAAGDIQMLGASSEAHNFALDPSNQYAFVALKGQNAIAQYKFDAPTGKLTANTPAKQTTSGDPRHIVFHPNGKFAYVINESASTMAAFAHDAGKLTEIQALTIDQRIRRQDDARRPHAFERQHASSLLARPVGPIHVRREPTIEHRRRLPHRPGRQTHASRDARERPRRPAHLRRRSGDALKPES